MASIKFLTYNVWSCEHVAVYRRIQAICEIIERHDPDVIFLQEVTDYIYSLFQEAPWWANYNEFSTKLKNQKSQWSKDHFPFCLLLSKDYAGKVVLPKYSYSWQECPLAGEIPSDLLSAWVHDETRHRLRIATCSLAGATPSAIGSAHRRARTRAFLDHFDAVHQPSLNEKGFVLDENVVLGGDFGWDDDLDGPLRLGDAAGGWVDAWRELRGGDAGGWTYDAAANPMVRDLNLPTERRRPDRFICKLRDFTLRDIEMVGVEPIPDVTRFDDGLNVLPVLPSHHFGLLLTISPKHKALFGGGCGFDML